MQKAKEADLHKLAGALLDYETLSTSEIRQVRCRNVSPNPHKPLKPNGPGVTACLAAGLAHEGACDANTRQSALHFAASQVCRRTQQSSVTRSACIACSRCDYQRTCHADIF